MGEFTGYYDVNGKKIHVGQYIKHKLDDVEGYVVKVNGQYEFGDGFELENYGADVKVITNK